MAGKTLEELKQILADKDASSFEKRSALDKIVRNYKDEAQEILIATLLDPEQMVRRGAIKLLGNFKAPEVTKALLGSLYDPEDEVKRSALRQLAEIGDVKVIPQVEKLLNNPSHLVKYETEKTLEKLDRIQRDAAPKRKSPAEKKNTERKKEKAEPARKKQPRGKKGKETEVKRLTDVRFYMLFDTLPDGNLSPKVPVRIHDKTMYPTSTIPRDVTVEGLQIASLENKSLVVEIRDGIYVILLSESMDVEDLLE